MEGQGNVRSNHSGRDVVLWTLLLLLMLLEKLLLQSLLGVGPGPADESGEVDTPWGVEPAGGDAHKSGAWLFGGKMGA